jgi:ribose transport system permease protein
LTNWFNNQFSKRLKSWFFDKESFQEGGALVSFLIICLLFYFLNRNFLTVYNISSVIRQVSFLSIVAIAQTLVLIIGGIDLSVGATAGLCGIAASWLMVEKPIDPFICLLLGVILGGICGFINGLLITKIKLPSFIATLGTMQVYSGLTMIITQGWAITKIPNSIFFLGNGFILGIPITFLIAALLFVLLNFFLKHTSTGRGLYAVGGNEQAAVLVGLKTSNVKILGYTLAGCFSALAGVLMVSKLTSGQPTIGDSWLMPSIAAAVIGGTSMTGGSGTALGTFFGTFIMGVIANGLVLSNVSPYWQNVVSGLIVITAVAFDMFRKSLEEKIKN